MKTPTEPKKINKYALNLFSTHKDFEKFLREIYGKNEEYIRARGFYPSIDCIAIDDVLYTMEEYDMSGKQISFYNKRTGYGFTIETQDRYTSWEDAVVEEPYEVGAWRDDVNYLD
jgi:hypothetical protein